MIADSIAGILFSIAAHAERDGLDELHRKVVDAARTAILDIPRADQRSELRQLAGWEPSDQRLLRINALKCSSTPRGVHGGTIIPLPKRQ